MLAIILLLLILPFAAAAVSLRAPDRVAGAVTAVTGVACFGLVLALVPAAAHRDLDYLSYLRIDAVSVVFLMATSFLYGAVAVYSIGYLAPSRRRRDPGFSRYSRRFYTGLNLFAWSMLAAPMMNNLALLWIAVEVTTVISALLVAIENTDGAAEAAWKYILIASAGLGLALLATIFTYYAGAQVLGQHYDLSFAPLLHAGAKLPHTPIRLAFVLAVVGFGTKMGLFPVHTWLPDASSEAPPPVSALLSGSLLAVSFYAILRYYQVAAAALGPGFPRDVLLVFGVASLLLAALYLLDQRDVKRMLAYSSVEHMGILAIGVSFGAPIALAGVLLHKLGSKRISGISGGLDLLPWSGPLFGIAILALCAMPPFGIFRSEFEIVEGGFSSARYATPAVLIVLVTLAFFGLTVAANRMLLVPARGRVAAGLPRGEPSAWMVVPVVAGVAALLVLGVHPPAELTGLLSRAVHQLGAVT